MASTLPLYSSQACSHQVRVKIALISSSSKHAVITIYNTHCTKSRELLVTYEALYILPQAHRESWQLRMAKTVSPNLVSKEGRRELQEPTIPLGWPLIRGQCLCDSWN